ncbi:MAG: ArsR/SmtB family transcription factor [Solirubrobacteraceae bacterium]
MVPSKLDPAAVPHPLPPRLADLIAQRFRVLGEPMRVKLLDHLRDGAAAVTELQEATGASQQNVSKHLGILHSEGLVTRVKEGNLVRYAIADESVFALCEQVCDSIRAQLAVLEDALKLSAD